MLSRFREPVSGFTHLFGALISAVGLFVLLESGVSSSNPWRIYTFLVFGVSLILLYSASTIYHLVVASEKAIKVLRRIDHSMIYVLIAGSYTPVCLISLRNKIGIQLFIAIWSLAVIGILVKNFWFNAPRWLSTGFYILMGWLVVVAIYPLSKALPAAALAWLVAGGIMYTVGGLIYALKRPNITTKYFGFHEIFHLFVLAGSFCHYWMILNYL